MINEIYTIKAEAEQPGRSRPSGIDALAAKIEQLVRHNPDVQLDHGTDYIRVAPLSPRGLPITVIVSDGRCSVALGSWHDDFECLDLALSFVELAVLGDLRLKVEMTGGKVASSTVERLMPDGTWSAESTVSAVRLFSWGRRTVNYFRNDWVPAPDLLESYAPPMFAPAHVFEASQQAGEREHRWPL